MTINRIPKIEKLSDLVCIELLLVLHEEICQYCNNSYKKNPFMSLADSDNINTEHVDTTRLDDIKLPIELQIYESIRIIHK